MHMYPCSLLKRISVYLSRSDAQVTHANESDVRKTPEPQVMKLRVSQCTLNVSDKQEIHLTKLKLIRAV